MERSSPTTPEAGHPGAATRRRPGLAFALALAATFLSSSPTIAQETEELADGIEIPPTEIQDVLAALQTDATTGRARLAEYLRPDLGDPNAIADRAIGLVRRLRGDPVETLGIASVIAEVAGIHFFAKPIVRSAVDSTFALPTSAGIAGWDLGPPDAPTTSGFQALADNDPRIAGDDRRGLRRPGAEGLTTDGVMGVRRVSLEVPDGSYRLILVTDDLSRTTTIAEPLGRTIVVNGRPFLILGSEPTGWIGYGVFGATAEGATAPTGGTLVLDIEAIGGTLDIAFPYDEGRPTFLSAIVLEPAAGSSTLVLTDETRKTLDDLLIAGREAESRLASAIADLLSGIATAAGVEQRIALLQLTDLPLALEDLLSVSPE